MSISPPVYIILLNYQGISQTFACLDSLRALNYLNYRIIVVDNASADASVSQLQTRLQTHPDEFRLIRSPNNGGYSAGNNLGIRYAQEQEKNDLPPKTLDASKVHAIQTTPQASAYIWLLNNDTTVLPDSLTPLVEESQRTGGLSGSLLHYPNDIYQQVGTRLGWWTGSAKGYTEKSVHDGMAVDSLSGASMLIPLTVFSLVGLLDESFFLYFEDCEFSVRCHRAGFPLTVATRSKVFHHEGATTGRKSRATQYYYHRNRFHMFFRFANPLQKMSIGLYTLFRQGRSVVKSRIGSDSEQRRAKQLACKLQTVAWQDFRQGISGPCPHPLDAY